VPNRGEGPVQRIEDFLEPLQRQFLAVLNDNVTMDKSTKSFHTLEMKRQSRQWADNGAARPY
jgi:hypothetical protein